MLHDAPRRPWPLWRRVLCFVGGIACIVAGVAGVLLPVIPGIPFLALGYFLLVPEFPSLGKPVVKAMRRWPRLRRMVPHRYRRRPQRARRRP